VQPADQLEQDLLEPELDAGRQVGVLVKPPSPVVLTASRSSRMKAGRP
jgi:hypothetical protein